MTDVTPTSPASPPPARTVPAGWYDEAGSPGVVRYWDGTAWTDHRQAKIAPIAAPVVVNAPGYRKAYKTSHGFHLIMTILTIGLWAPVWLIMAIYNSSRA